MVSNFTDLSYVAELPCQEIMIFLNLKLISIVENSKLASLDSFAMWSV